MVRRNNISAGLLLIRRKKERLEVFLAHPGGPFWANRDFGAWTIPKGVIVEGEEPLAAAQREFEEETGIISKGPYLPLGSIRQRAGKTVHGWAWEGDADPTIVRSNTMRCEWPPRSGEFVVVPEIDRCHWFTPEWARRKINAAQAEFIDRLEEILGSTRLGREGLALESAQRACG
jgi:predicted NUDIX family NTP pyrophosphohydrolase